MLRWSEHARKRELRKRGIKVIDLLTDKIEDTIDAFLSCEKIITTSLHGLIIADAYNIPNAWLIADTGAGKEYKFWDYLISVDKCRAPADLDIKTPYWTEQRLLREFHFDDRPIKIDLDLLRATCPLLNRTPAIEEAEACAMALGVSDPEIVDQPRAAVARRETALQEGATLVGEGV
ncbi:polysaccharide pyruvyl transferase family protein [Paracoccus sp. (in: a-proteobacteria)]|uniref:polysaccharide pyruvyl transferase family protein n=1 Tax=Paracoccus sp. TaxID=267 RepID=UPI002AFEB161|nr:polysaccharide pyruvyl transferase family protein [Paracoccus sp. (in: a-proteobacteria)]